MLAGAYESAEEPEKAAEQYEYILELEEEEGAVLLKNDNNALPLSADEIKNEGMNWVLRYFGKTALSRNPQRGDNAIFHFVKDICENADNSWQVPAVLHMIAEQFADDFYGEKSKLSANGFTPLPLWQDALARYLKELGL